MKSRMLRVCHPEIFTSSGIDAGNPPIFEGTLEVEFSRYYERGDFDEEEQIYGCAGAWLFASG